MSMRSLREFLATLRRERQIVEISAPVDPHLEIAEIHRRVIAAGGPALLFTNPSNSSFPVVTNLFGTARRIDLAFGPRPERFVRDVVHMVETIMPPTLGKLWSYRHLGMQGLKLGLKRVSTGPVTEAMDRPARLDRLPILTTWQEDGGPFVTLPLVYTEHPDTGAHNLGMYRIHVYDQQTTGIHWQIQKGGGFHYNVAESRGESLPATILLGGPPALILSAIAPLPENVPELMLASLLMGERLPRVASSPPDRIHPLVAECEFAIVGKVPPNERRLEGPFGDHYGYYSLAHEFPVFHADAVYHRRDAIYPATVVGKPRQEDFLIGDYLQSLLSPLFPVVMPTVRDLWSYGETGFHSLAAAVVRDRYAREAMVSAFRILGEGQLSLTKFLILTDASRDLSDFAGLLEHVLARCEWWRDLFIFSNLSHDTLDYTGPKLNHGSKGVLLGLGDPVRELPREFRGEPPRGVSDVRVFCAGCIAVAGAPYGDDPAQAQAIASHDAFAEWPLVVLVDDASVAQSQPQFLWSVFTRFEPAGDIYSAGADIRRHHLAYTPPIVIDARKKPSYPKELFPDAEIVERVDCRWDEYFPNGMESVARPSGEPDVLPRIVQR
ncbi:MAG TPA: UbiD family decarboxylase [Blastocatellia bacterium]|nr:UbiD family decarboxylase [Blastocatellia bacterium]